MRIKLQKIPHIHKRAVKTEMCLRFPFKGGWTQHGQVGRWSVDSLQISRIQHQLQLQTAVPLWGMPHPATDKGWHDTRWGQYSSDPPQLHQASWGLPSLPSPYLPLPFTAVDPWHISHHKLHLNVYFSETQPTTRPSFVTALNIAWYRHLL